MGYSLSLIGAASKRMARGNGTIWHDPRRRSLAHIPAKSRIFQDLVDSAHLALAQKSCPLPARGHNVPKCPISPCVIRHALLVPEAHQRSPRL
jgi:hypothetical protein